MAQATSFFYIYFFLRLMLVTIYCQYMDETERDKYIYLHLFVCVRNREWHKPTPGK